MRCHPVWHARLAPPLRRRRHAGPHPHDPKGRAERAVAGQAWPGGGGPGAAAAQHRRGGAPLRRRDAQGRVAGRRRVQAGGEARALARRHGRERRGGGRGGARRFPATSETGAARCVDDDRRDEADVGRRAEGGRGGGRGGRHVAGRGGGEGGLDVAALHGGRRAGEGAGLAHDARGAGEDKGGGGIVGHGHLRRVTRRGLGDELWRCAGRGSREDGPGGTRRKDHRDHSKRATLSWLHT
mmetsp:Transcript_25049/g.84414  ORF Transcript_25049/g.84414 Transcript_25049/m.84414 type:complete len:240 (-) Transcript_25049:150-869(-)